MNIIWYTFSLFSHKLDIIRIYVRCCNRIYQLYKPTSTRSIQNYHERLYCRTMFNTCWSSLPVHFISLYLLYFIEAPVLFAKACELFILDLTIRSYCYSNGDDSPPPTVESIGHNPPLPPSHYLGSGKRRTLTREAVILAAQQTDIFDFLVGVLSPGTKPQYVLDAEALVNTAASSLSSSSSSSSSSNNNNNRNKQTKNSNKDNNTTLTTTHHPYNTVPFATGPRQVNK